MTLISVRREVGEFRKRYKWMALAVVSAFAVLLVRVIQLQIVEHKHYSAIAIDNITKTIVLPSVRGVIRDRHGAVIATNRPAYHVYLTPRLFRLDEDLPKLSAWMKLSTTDQEALRGKLERVSESRRNQQIKVFSDIDRDQVAALETHKNELLGMDVIAVPTRLYHFHELGAHAIGYLNEVSAEDLEKLTAQGYKAGDVVGRSGVERAWESYLRGRSGYKRVLVDARGEVRDFTTQGRKAKVLETRDPVPGRDLVVTLDMNLMRIIQKAFRAYPSGAALAVDVHTGRLRALYSKPAYDLNEMSGQLTVQRAAELQENVHRPLIDKTLYESYFPGSIFKPVTGLAGLQEQIATAATTVKCTGFYDLGKHRARCTKVHGETNFEMAIVQSCNVYFWKLAEQVGLDRIAQYAHQFGLGEKTGIGINTESAGFIPTKDWYTKQYGQKFRVGFTLNESIGQGNTRVTLLQMAMTYAALANGGTLYVPQLVEALRHPDGTLIEEFAPKVRGQVGIDPKHLALVNAGLRGVVNHPKGTAYVDGRAQDAVPVAGKTGTAQVSKGSNTTAQSGSSGKAIDERDNAWFAGFAPADRPQIAIVVLVEHGGAGGKHAAPIALEVLQQYLGAPSSPASSSPTSSRTMR
jgi:penicillin-binding protein 2